MSSKFEEALSSDLQRIAQLPLEEQLAEFARIRETLEGVMNGTPSADDVALGSSELVS